MNRAQQLEQLKQDLLNRREALTQALAGDLTMLQEMRRGAGDVVDFAADSAAEVLSTQLAQSASRELGNIELALLKMKKNCYGQCEECSQHIAWPRLEALPYAAHCIQCQRMLEALEEDERGHGRPISFPNLGDGSSSFRDSDLV